MRTTTILQASALLAAGSAYAKPFQQEEQMGKRSDNPKYVFAHHMVGNTYPYTVDNWASDIQLAHANGIDAFALNIGSDSWQPQRVADA